MMRSDRLEKLEKLSGQRADKSRSVLHQAIGELRRIEQHHAELASINKHYQGDVVGSDSVSPRLLAMRRSFVTQLSDKLDQLTEQSQQKELQVRDYAREHQLHASQHSAIELLQQRQSHCEWMAVHKAEVFAADESARNQYIRHLKDNMEPMS